MGTDRYRIISSGRPISGHDSADVIGRVANLFKTTPDKVSKLLGGKPVLIRRGLDETTAGKMFGALKNAGLLCKVEPETAVPTFTNVTPAIKAAAGGISVIDPELGPGSVEHSVVQASELTVSSAGDGLDFGRAGARSVPYGDITLMAVYEMPSTQDTGLRLMVYTSLSRRPYVIGAQNIRYQSFQGVKSEAMNTSIKQLILHLHEKNPALVIDGPTQHFMGGALPRQLKLEETVLAAALGLELNASGMFDVQPQDSEQEFMDMSGTLNLLKQADASYAGEVSEGRSKMAYAGAVASAFVLALGLMGQMRLLEHYSYYLGSRNLLLNHLLMWPSLILGAVVLAIVIRAALHVRRHEWYAQSSVRLMLICFSVYASLRFGLAIFFIDRIRSGKIPGALAFYEVTVAYSSRSPLSMAVFYSYIWLALPLCAVLYFMFVRSKPVTKNYQ